MIYFFKAHPAQQAMSGAARPVDLNEGDIRRNPGEPNAAQSASSEYSKPRVQWQGLTIAIENPSGSVRRGRNRDGVTWEQRMHYAYGEVLGSTGVDGDPVDVFLGPNMEAPMVYVVHQRKVNRWDEYDEDKCMVGFDSQDDAVAAFLACYTDPRFLGPVTALPVDEFVAKVLATRDAPAMIKAVLFFKSHVGAYIRGGRLVNVAGYQGRNARPHATPGQMSLFGGPESGKPLPPSPLQGKDAVAHTPDMFGEPLYTDPTRQIESQHDHLLADFPEGAHWSRGRGRIAGHYAVELPGGDVVGNYHEKPEDAAAQAKQWLENRAFNAKKKAERTEAIGSLRSRLMDGGEATDADLARLGLKPGSSGLKWFIPAAAEVFGITSHAVRPHIKDVIRAGHTDMGTKLEFVEPKKALAAIATGLRPPDPGSTAEVTVASRKRIKDDNIGTYTEVTLSNGKVWRIQRLNSTESMGLPGWHNIDGNDMDSATSITWIADTEKDAIDELVSRAKNEAPKAALAKHPTDTPEFKAWFGDSKVVDGSGKPMVVYHGTADDFAEFKHGHANKKDNGWLGQGFYFTNDTEISNSYTNLKAGASPNVMPVYLQLKNPYQATIRDKEFLMLAERRGDKDAAGKWISELEAKGHDGVILSYGHIQNGDYPAEYVVFKPTQIKSATGNNGRFDPGSADITKSLPVVFLAPR